jgi:P4 family phage/plasmid primase-like protien
VNLQNAIAEEQSKREERQRRAGRLRSLAESNNGNLARMPLTPNQWFDSQFPGLSERHGAGVREEIDRQGVTFVVDLNEDFLAATLGSEGSPDAPTVYSAQEQRFFTYSPPIGIYICQREPVLLSRLSALILTAARACRSSDCRTDALEYGLRDANQLRGVIRKAMGQLEADPNYFRTDLNKYIAAANGMVRLDGSNKLEPFAPHYRRRNKLNVPFDPAATCPTFLNVLMRPALEPDDLELLQRWCGLSLIGENLSQKMVILTGTPGGGKGCFVRVLTGIIGQNNLASLRPQLLTERFEFSRYVGKTLLYGPDVAENFLNQRGASALKSLTGYDPMTVEFKNSNESPSMMGNFNVIVTCNSRLVVHLEGDVEAWRRRLIIIDYHKPKPEIVIADLDQQILATEGPGVLNWMLEGLAKLRANGWQLHLTSPQQATVDNLLLESDGHTLFVKNELIKSDDAQLTVSEVFTTYAEYCNDRGWATIGRSKFGQVIGDVVTRQYGKTARNDIPDPLTGKSQRGWRGLALRSNSIAAVPENERLTFDDPERQAAWDNWKPHETGKDLSKH